jgi:fibronectin type 3 domain-containing protein
MKKKIPAPKKRIASKSASRIRHSSRSNTPVEFSFIRRIIIVGGLSVILLAIIFVPGKQSVRQEVAGISIARPIFAQSTVSWTNVTGAIAYNIYYKEKSDATFRYAVRRIPSSSTSYTITHLKKGASYEYKISAIAPSGREFWWSDVKPLENITAM